MSAIPSPQHTATEYTEDIQELKLEEVEAVSEPLEPISRVLSKYLPKSVVEQLNKIESRLNHQTIVRFVSTKTKIPPLAIFLVALFSWIQAFKKQPFLATLCTNLYPIWWSVKGVERPRVNDDERLLTYWSVNGAFLFVDHLATLQATNARQKKTKAYFILRILCNFWLQRDGSLFVYRKLLRPLLSLE